MYQLRIYTLSTPEALRQYATVQWPGHVVSMLSFGVTVHGFWTEQQDGTSRLIALLSFREGLDPAAFTAAYVASPEFAADMQGFDLDAILGVEERNLDAVAGSPLA